MQHAEEIHVTSTSSTSNSDPRSSHAGLPEEKTLEGASDSVNQQLIEMKPL